MRDGLDILFQLCDILQILVFHHDHGKRSHSVLIHQNVLSLYGLQGVRKISQKVVIRPGMLKAIHGREQKDNCHDQNQDSVSGNPLSYLNQTNQPLSF